MAPSAPSASLTVSLCSPLATQPGQTGSSAVYSGCKFDFSSWLPPSKPGQSCGWGPRWGSRHKADLSGWLFLGVWSIQSALDKMRGVLLMANGVRYSSAVPQRARAACLLKWGPTLPLTYPLRPTFLQRGRQDLFPPGIQS